MEVLGLDENVNLLDAPEALCASPDGHETVNLEKVGMDIKKQVKKEDSDSPLSDMNQASILIWDGIYG